MDEVRAYRRDACRPAPRVLATPEPKKVSRRAVLVGRVWAESASANLPSAPTPR